MKRTALFLVLFCLVSCRGKEPSQDARAYLFDNDGRIPEVHLRVEAAQWNRLLEAFDGNPKTRETVHAGMTFIKGNGRAALTLAP